MQQHNFLYKIMLFSFGLMSSIGSINAELPSPQFSVPVLDARAHQALLGDSDLFRTQAPNVSGDNIFDSIQDRIAVDFGFSHYSQAENNSPQLAALIDVYSVTAYMKTLIQNYGNAIRDTDLALPRAYLSNIDFYADNDLVIAGSSAIRSINNNYNHLGDLVYSTSNAIIAASNAIEAFNGEGQNNPPAVLNYNYWVSTDCTLLFDTATYGSVINGNNHIITLSQADYPLIIPTCDINFTNVVFDGAYNGFIDTTAGNVTFDDGTELILKRDIVLGESWKFAGRATLNGNGHSITFDECKKLKVACGSTLTLKNVKLINNNDESIINLSDATSSVIMSDVIWSADNNYALRSATRSNSDWLDIDGSMRINGKMSIDWDDRIYFDNGSEFVLLENTELETSLRLKDRTLINGNGFKLTFGECNSLRVQCDSELTLKNIVVHSSNEDSVLKLADISSRVIFSNTTWNVDNKYAKRDITRYGNPLLDIYGSININGKAYSDGDNRLNFECGSELVLLEDTEFDSTIIFRNNNLINGNGFNVTFGGDCIFKVACEANLTLKNMNLVDITGHPIHIANDDSTTLCLSNVTWNQLGSCYNFSGAGYVAIDGTTTFNGAGALKNANWWVLDGATMVANKGISLKFNDDVQDPILYLGRQGNLFSDGGLGSGTLELRGATIELHNNITYNIQGGTLIVSDLTPAIGCGTLTLGDGSCSPKDVNLIFKPGAKFMAGQSLTITNNNTTAPIQPAADNFASYWQYAYADLNGSLPASDWDLALTASTMASQALEIVGLNPWQYQTVADVNGLIDGLTAKMTSNSNYISSIRSWADSNFQFISSQEINGISLDCYNLIIANSNAIADALGSNGNDQLFDPSWTWSMAAGVLQSYSIGLPVNYATNGSVNDFKVTASADAVTAYNIVLESQNRLNGSPRLVMELGAPVSDTDGNLIPMNQYNVLQVLNRLANKRAADLQLVLQIQQDVHSLETNVSQASHGNSIHSDFTTEPGTTFTPSNVRPTRDIIL